MTYYQQKQGLSLFHVSNFVIIVGSIQLKSILYLLYISREVFILIINYCNCHVRTFV